MIPAWAQWFVVLDCHKGYWQVEIDKRDADFTSFITEFGRFRYLRAPMGLISAGDQWVARSDEAFERVKNMFKLVDDMLIMEHQ